MEYIIIEKEKSAIRKLLDNEKLERINFFLNDFNTNLKVINENEKKKDLYREFGEISKDLIYIYSGIKKQYQSKLYEQHKYQKEYGKYIELSEDVEKIYVPISLNKLDQIANKPLNEFLIGTTGKFVAETKPYDIEKVVILEINKNDVPYFATTDDFPDILTRILVPPFSIKVSKLELNEIKKKFEQEVKLKNKKSKNNEETENELTKDSEKSDESNNSKKNKITSNDAKVEKIRPIIKVNLEKIKTNLFDVVTPPIDISKNIEIIKKEYKNGELSEKDIIEQASDLGIGIYNEYRDYTRLLNQIKKVEKELKHLNNRKKVLKGEEAKENNQNIRNLTKELKEKENNLNTCLEKITEIESEIRKFLKLAFDEKELDMSKQTIKEDNKVSQLDMVKYMELEKSLRTNLNKTNQIIDDVTLLIKSQKKFARIGAECDAGYSSIIDGFAIKSEAEKLKNRLEKIYKEFETYYFNKLQNKVVDENYEMKLGKILNSSEQVDTFLNYLYNPKSTMKKIGINRFEELILIEENELKRVICKTTENLIAKANLLIIDDELDAIEFKSTTKKILDLLTGKFKIEKYRELKLEEAAEKVSLKLEKAYSINENYKIHDIIAEIMIFEAENIDDKLIEKYLDRLNQLKVGIVKNFVIEEEKVLNKVDKLKGVNLPIDIQKMTKEAEVDLEISLLYHKYGYDKDFNTKEEIVYQDTSANEIKQILDYIKLSF